MPMRSSRPSHVAHPSSAASLTPPGVFTDVGEVFPWIAAGVQQLTGDELQA